MPNWCENELIVNSQSQEAFDKFMEWYDKGFSFDRVIPYPEKFKEMDNAYPNYSSATYQDDLAKYLEKYGTNKDGYNSGGYGWCADNWGTKWDVNADDIYVNDTGNNSLNINFSTAWSPPTPVIEHLATMFPECSFYLQYWEGGMGFAGTAFYENGYFAGETYDKNYRGNRGD